MSPFAELLDKSGPHKHLVQFYDDDLHVLAKNVGRYLSAGLLRGEGAVMIATNEHAQAFIQQLENCGVSASAAMRDGRFVCRDAHATLAEFMIGGQPDWEKFERIVGSLIHGLRARIGDASICAYGEMVDVLWNSGQTSAASRLEDYWNKLLSADSFSLFCAYQIDIFGREFQAAVLDDVLCSHTHLVPAGGNGDLATALDRALDEVLGTRAEGLRRLMKANFRPAWAVVPRAESNVLWLRNNLPDYADEILSRARQYFHSALTSGHLH